jgi:hypothetical protein
LIDIHSDELSTVLSNSCPLADNLGRPYHLVEDLLVDGSEGSGTGSLLAGSGSRVSLGLGEDTSLGEEDDVFVGKLLLEFSGEPNGRNKFDDGGVREHYDVLVEMGERIGVGGKR